MRNSILSRIGKAGISAILLLALSLPKAEAQIERVTYYTQSNYVKSNTGDCRAAEIGNLEYTSEMYTWDEITGQIYTSSTGCQQCDANGGCTYNQGVDMVTGRTNMATTITLALRAYEHDQGDSFCGTSPERCSFVQTSCSECVVWYQNAYNFRDELYPENFWQSTQEWGSSNNHQYAANVKWKYNGQTNEIQPDCVEQTASMTGGEVHSWSVYLVNGRSYFFSTRDSDVGGVDLNVRLYAPNGHTLKKFSLPSSDGNSTVSGNQGQISYTADVTGYHYVEVTSKSGEDLRTPVPVPTQGSFRLTYSTTYDGEAPVVTCPPNSTVNAGSGCQYTFSGLGGALALSPYGITDNCTDFGDIYTNPVPWTRSPAGTTFDLGVTPVTISATDESGNTGSCNFTITVIESTPPSITCPSNKTVIADANCTYTYSGISGAAALLPTAYSDNCTAAGDLILSRSPSGGTFIVGTTTVTWTAEDESGNTGTCSFTVTVRETTPPNITCPANRTVDAGANCQYTYTGLSIISLSPTSYSDNCTPNPLISLSRTPSSNTFSLGTTTVTWTATDLSGNTRSCNFNVTVRDVTAPVVSCVIPEQLGGNITVDADANCEFTFSDFGLLFLQPYEITDNCTDFGDIFADPKPWTRTPAGNTFPLGTTLVTISAVDESGNTGTCSFNITVEDNTPPVLTCPPTLTVAADGNCQFHFNELDLVPPAASDNCTASGDLLLSLGQYSEILELGTNTATWIAEDVAGNVGSCTFEVIVEDHTGPEFYCGDVTVSTDPGECFASFNLFIDYLLPNGGWRDNCGVINFLRMVDPNTGQYVPETVLSTGSYTTQILATDDSGNSNECTFTITVEDNIEPLAVCQDITIQLDADGNASVTAGDLDGGSTDNCGIVGYSASPVNFSCSDLPSTAVTLTVTDLSGNSGTCSATVFLEDVDAPILTCPGDRSFNVTAGTCERSITLTPPIVEDACNAYYQVSDTIERTVDGDSVSYILTGLLPNATSDATLLVYVRGDIDAGAEDFEVYGDDGSYIGHHEGGGIQTCSAIFHVVSFTIPAATINSWAADDTIIISVDASSYVAPICGTQDDGFIILSYEADGGYTLVNDFNNTDDASGTYPLGTTTVTWTATDASGNASTCSQTITINDNRAPVLTCEPALTVTIQDGLCETALTLAGPTVEENCTNYTLINDYTGTSDASGTYATGTTTVTWTATDDAGNTGTCYQSITVLDGESPVLVCTDVTVDEYSGDCDTLLNLLQPQVTDNCSSTFTFINDYNGTSDATDFYPEGTTTVNWTVTDESGNAATCSVDITVNGHSAPVLSCPGSVSVNAASGLCERSVTLQAPTVTDNCNAYYQVSDTIERTVDGDSVSYVLTGFPPNATSDATLSVYVRGDISAGAEDFEVYGDDGSYIGHHEGGGILTCSAIFHAVSFTIPAATINSWAADDTIIISVDASNYVAPICGAEDDGFVILSYQAGGGYTLVNDYNGTGDASDTYPVGTTTVTWTATDASGNSSTCTQDVTVRDNVAPSALCQDITVQLDGAGSANVFASQVDAGSSDICGIESLSVSPSDLTCADLGVQSVELTVTDVNGNASTCTASVTVADTLPPTAVCQDLTIQLNGSGNASLSAEDLDGGSTDNCGITGLSASRTQFNCSDYGDNAVTLTVTDLSGNSASCNAFVIVRDILPPTVTCQDITAQLDAGGYQAVGTNQLHTASDNCQLIPSGAFAEFDCSDAGTTVPVAITRTDWRGNSASCTAHVTIEDNLPPVVLCQDATVQLDDEGDATVAAGDVDGGSSDNCGLTLTLDSQYDFTCLDLGSTFGVMLTGTDPSGNSASCTANVTVADDNYPCNQPPVAVCQDITVSADASCQGNGSIDNGSYDPDGDALTYTASPAGPYPLGTTAVTLTVTDPFGESDDCAATITVIDDTAPSAVCRDVTVQLDAAGTGSTSAEAVNNGSADACGISSLSPSPTVFDCGDIGTNAVILSVTDGSGNTGTCTAIVTVDDNIAPSMQCADLTVYLDASGTATISESMVDGGVTDACGIAGLFLNRTAFGCGDVGTNSVTLTAQDFNGNSASCTATVTVIDNAPPMALCGSLEVQLDASGSATIAVDDIDLGSSDACGIASMTLSQSSFDCGDVGINTVGLTVTDINGNAVTCEATVEVYDLVAPSAVCRDVTVQLDAAGTGSTSAEAVNNGSADACGISSLSASPTVFDCGDIGNNAVILSVTDGSGNTGACTAIVTVEDNVAPAAACRDITLQLDGSGQAAIAAADIDNGSNDACGIASMSASPILFDCGDVGANNATLTVTDNNGNHSECTAVVTVEDNVPPTLNCSDITVGLGIDCNLSISASDVASYSDACGIAAATVIPGSFATADAGPNTVSVTVADIHGNTSSCTAIVTVIKRQTLLTNLGAFQGQYSDYPELRAQLTDAITGNPLAGQTITFSLNGGTATALTDASGIATTAAIRLGQAPTVLGSNYTVDVSWSGVDCYLPATDSDPFEILQEDARVAYQGTVFASTANVNSSQATILLIASVSDISATGSAGSDDKPGNIGNATVTFVDRETGNPISPPLPVSPVPGDSLNGTVTFEWTVDIGNSESESYVVGVIVDHYYTRNSSDDDAVVTVSLPACDFITGGGHIVMTSSAGKYAADPGTKFNFGFNVKYNRRGTNLQGRVTAIVRRMEADGVLHIYRIKGNQMSSLGIAPNDITNTAEFTGSANITDVTDPLNPVSVEGNGELRMVVTDNGEPGAGIDLLSLQLYRQGELMFASNWNGAQANEQLIDGGNIEVHTCGNNGGGEEEDPCAGSGDSDSDGDGVCDVLDVCEGYDDAVDTDGDGIPDGCDDCSNVLTSFASSTLSDNGDGTPSSISLFLGGQSGVQFSLSSVDSKGNGPSNKRFTDIVTVTWEDNFGTVHTYGVFDGSSLASSTVEIDLPGEVHSVTVELANGLANSVAVSIGLSAVSYCSNGFSVKASGPVDAAMKPDPGMLTEIHSTAYPNPFIHSTTIEFTLPEGGATVLEVISLGGETVHISDLGTLEAGFKHQVVLDSEGHWASGVYHYRIVSGKSTFTGKLLYVK